MRKLSFRDKGKYKKFSPSLVICIVSAAHAPRRICLAAFTNHLLLPDHSLHFMCRFFNPLVIDNFAQILSCTLP